MQLNGAALPVSATGIAWKTDLRSRFSSTVDTANFNTLPALRGGAALLPGPLNSDERFVVWMRTAALPNFRKLWGVIDRDLDAGSVVTVSIVNACVPHFCMLRLSACACATVQVGCMPSLCDMRVPGVVVWTACSLV